MLDNSSENYDRDIRPHILVRHSNSEEGRTAQ